MNRKQRGKCDKAFKKRDGWHVCMRPHRPEDKDHVHVTPQGPPAVGDIVAIRGEGNDVGYHDVGIVSRVDAKGYVYVVEGGKEKRV